MRTKNRKTFTTCFFPVGADIEHIVVDWLALLKERGFGPDDPLFPATKVTLGENGFEAGGLARQHWSNAAAIRRIFKEAFARAGLPYANPHSFRNTLARLGERTTITTEAWAAWGANLGHENVLTTFRSYGQVPDHRRTEIFDQLRAREEAGAEAHAMPEMDDEAMLALLAARLRSKAA
ncbi:MAG: hypothetical protein M9945_02280 [Aquamicrobium sp.]|uniref:hypothetical protein n=1 Tax=Aquamicrobium sp. TaxID=1872579 RepID=UPI00349EFC1E|nr:hypothetical protein [Aquamicrobium sp.]